MNAEGNPIPAAPKGEKSLPTLKDSRVEGDYIIMHSDDFEYLLACLDNQKFINEAPQCGDAMAMPEDEYQMTQREMQRAIDSFNRQCRILWMNRDKG